MRLIIIMEFVQVDSNSVLQLHPRVEIAKTLFYHSSMVSVISFIAVNT